MTVPKLLRLTLTLSLIVGVWITSTWTVALAISLLAVTNESLHRTIIREMKYRTERQKAEFRLFKRTKKIKAEIDTLKKKYDTNKPNQAGQ